jgi:signal transduction histidine kinase
VTVTLAQEGQEIQLEGIRQRVGLLGGRLKIESKPGSGTRVQVVVPIVQTRNKE